MEKNNAYDSHLMLESYPLCSQHMVKLAEEVCDDDPIEADGVWFRLNLLFSSTAIVLSWQNSWSNPRRFAEKNTF